MRPIIVKSLPVPRRERAGTQPAPAPSAYAALHAGFAWRVEPHMNMADLCCSRWARNPETANSIAIKAHRCWTNGQFGRFFDEPLAPASQAAPVAQRGRAAASAVRSDAPRSAQAAGDADNTNSAAPRHVAYTYAELQRASDGLSHALRALGVRRGDRVAVVLPQRFETAVAYIAILQMGAVAMPLSQLFGPDALEYRLSDSQAVVAIGDASTLANLQAVRGRCPALRSIIGVADWQPAVMPQPLPTGLALAIAAAQPQDVALGALPLRERPAAEMAAAIGSFFGIVDLNTAIAQNAGAYKPARTRADDPAVLIYTSGTTGNPKGALIPHRALIGNLSGFVASQNWFGFDPQDATQPSDAVFWSPADWAWTGGLMDALLPTLYFGREIVAFNGRFSPEVAFEILQTHRVTHSFLFPTALKAMMKAYPKPKRSFAFNLHALMSAGEAVGDAVGAYCAQELGVAVNEMFGQTEINYIVGNCTRLYPAKPGSMGRAYPGHRVALLDEAGCEQPQPESGAPHAYGEIAVHRQDVHGHNDPVFFLGYWQRDAATREKYTGDPRNSWCRTGDLASMDSEGYLWYLGRADDMFKAAGYRIGPGEIENCLVKHALVANAAVVPKPCAQRGAVVKAFVVLAPAFVAALEANSQRPDWTPQQIEDANAALKLQWTALLQAHVRGKLAPYEYPKDIEFIDALPMTTTGKVQRRLLRQLEVARAQA